MVTASVILLMLLNQPLAFEFSAYDTIQVEEFCRYCSTKEVKTRLAFSLSDVLTINADRRTTLELFKGFASDYGFDLTKKGKDGKIHNPFPEFVLQGKPESPDTFWAAHKIDENAMLRKAYNYCVGAESPTDLLTRCSYSLVPRLTKSLTRTEGIMGEFWHLHEGRIVREGFIFPP